jgi:hypothetical protein
MPSFLLKAGAAKAPIERMLSRQSRANMSPSRFGIVVAGETRFADGSLQAAGQD